MKLDNVFLRYLSAFIIIPIIYVGINKSFNQSELVEHLNNEQNKEKNKEKLIFNLPRRLPHELPNLKQDKLGLFFKMLPRKSDYSPVEIINTSQEILEFGMYYSKLQRIYTSKKIQKFLTKCRDDKTIITVIKKFCKLKLEEI